MMNINWNKSAFCQMMCFIIISFFFSCVNNDSYENVDSVLVSLNYKIKSKNGIFHSPENAKIDISFQNQLDMKCPFTIICDVFTDNHHKEHSFSYNYTAMPLENLTREIDVNIASPGIYQCMIYLKSDYYQSDTLNFNIGYDPEKINCTADSKPDFNLFWEQTKSELATINPQYQMTLLEKHSQGPKNVYLVTMQSFGDVEIAGYYEVPKVGTAFPVIIEYVGYGGGEDVPSPESNPGIATFTLSLRGQGIQRDKNQYGEWMIYGLKSKETYYYREAYMDLIRSIDFVVSRPEVDNSRLMVTGGSQGGGLAVVASALDSRIKGCAIDFPFFSDIKDYFSIVDWPKVVFENYLNANTTQTWEDIYDVLTYFDVKNFAPLLKCPLLIGISLQDATCPPHTQFAIYNAAKSDKHYYVCPECGHGMKLEYSLPHTVKFFNSILFPDKS